MEKKDPVAIGSRIRKLRLSLGMNMTEFARLLNMGDPLGKIQSGTVNNWETGKNSPNAKRLKLISEAAGVSVEFLLTGTNSSDLDYVRNFVDELFINKSSRFHEKFAKLQEKTNGIGMYALFRKVLKQRGNPRSKEQLSEVLHLISLESYDKLMNLRETLGKASPEREEEMLAHYVYLTLTEIYDEDLRSNKSLYLEVMGKMDEAVWITGNSLAGHETALDVTKEMRSAVKDLEMELTALRDRYRQILKEIVDSTPEEDY